MKRKTRLYYWGVLLAIVISIGIFLCFKKNEIIINIGLANPSDNIDLSISLDEIQIFNDSIYYEHYKLKTIKKNLPCGIYKLKIESNKVNTVEERNIILICDLYILIDYYPKVGDSKETSGFYIEKSIAPFYPN